MTSGNSVHLTRLKLTDFRNYPNLSLDFDNRHVVLTGDNGAGKTNLLEAVSFLSPGRGMRRAAYADVARRGGSGAFAVFAALEGMAGPVEIGTSIVAGSNGGSRKLRVNGANARAADDLLDHLRLVWLTPAMDGLFTGPAADRRRFLDRQVLAIDPRHGRRVLDYERAMRSRNRLLVEGRHDPSWFDGIERQMAGLGAGIAVARRELVARLRARIDSEAAGPFPQAEIALDDFAPDMPADDAGALEDAFGDRLRRDRPRDAAAGRTLTGPHRSDLLVRHREKDMQAAQCSTGEQKALLVGLVLAHAGLTAAICGAPPLLLLDEIAAHLDPGRRAALFELVDRMGGQAFMTGTDPQMFAALGGRAQCFTVAAGSVETGSGFGESTDTL